MPQRIGKKSSNEIDLLAMSAADGRSSSSSEPTNRILTLVSVGLNPKHLAKEEHSFQAITPSPVRSKSSKASLNSKKSKFKNPSNKHLFTNLQLAPLRTRVPF